MNINEIIESFTLMTFNSSIAIQTEQQIANAIIAIETLKNIYKLTSSERVLNGLNKIKESIAIIEDKT